MKKLLFSLLAATLFLSSCSKDDDDNDSVASIVAGHLKTGTWRITSYIDNGTDETADFNGFTFTFKNNGEVDASNSILTVSGAWANDNDDSDPEIDMDFSTSSMSMFQEISEDWDIVSHSATQVSLRHVSGGGGGTDLLVFQKN